MTPCGVQLLQNGYVMLLPQRYRVGIAISVLIVAACTILLYSLRYPTPGVIRKMTLEIIAPLDYAVNMPLKGLREVWKRYVFLIGLKEENKRLKDINARLSDEIIREREAYLESIRLRNLLKLQDDIPYPTVAARIVGRNPSSLFKMILINRGESDGLRPGLPVVAVPGVVGRILETSWNVSRVLLIIDESSNIDAVVQENRVQGVLQGASSTGCNLKYVSKTAEVKAGDVVISSGMGGVFPKGLPLGVVRYASKKEADLFQRVNVAPFVDPAGIEEVLVIISDGKGKK